MASVSRCASARACATMKPDLALLEGALEGDRGLLERLLDGAEVGDLLLGLLQLLLEVGVLVLPALELGGDHFEEPLDLGRVEPAEALAAELLLADVQRRQFHHRSLFAAP